MSFICDNCGKGTVHGRQSTHGRGIAGKRWKKRAQKTIRTFKPNLQKASMMIMGKKVQARLCTECIRRFKKDGKIGRVAAVASI